MSRRTAITFWHDSTGLSALGKRFRPLPTGKLRLANPHARYTSGLYERRGTWMHVSPGLGTTFVPFRFFARPEATELVLQPA